MVPVGAVIGRESVTAFSQIHHSAFFAATDRSHIRPPFNMRVTHNLKLN